MSGSTTARLPRGVRRRAMLLALVNGGLWSAGNGLTSGALIVYLAQDLGARGRSIGLILAAPALVGTLRLVTPAVIAWMGTARRACLSTSLAAYVVLCGVPLVGVPGLVPRSAALGLLITLLCVHQLLEYVGAAALWAWLAAIVPQRIRGRFFARRQRWQLAVLIPTVLAGGWFADWWRASSDGGQHVLIGYAVPNAVGAALLLASLLPLVAMPATPGPARRNWAWREIRTPLVDRRFIRLLLFGCWLSAANGIMQSAQNIYPKQVLGLGVRELSLMVIAMRVGQMAASGWVGRASDRYGNRPVLIASQLVVSLGPLFFLLATPAEPRWLWGAWLAWSAYVGLNVCLPNLALKLAGHQHAAAYVATYFALSGVSYTAATLAGGWLLDWFEGTALLLPLPLGPMADRFDVLFVASWLGRLSAVAWLWWVIEPGAWSWRAILTRRRPADAPAPTHRGPQPPRPACWAATGRRRT